MTKRKAEIDKQKAGRRSLFKPEYIGKAEKLCALGATDVELADFFEVDTSTWVRWLATYPDLRASVKIAKEQADQRVERSLYHRATGYTYDAVKIFMPAGAAEPVYAPYREHVPPDPTACIFWLKNRKPAEWREGYTNKTEVVIEDRRVLVQREIQDILALPTLELEPIEVSTS